MANVVLVMLIIVIIVVSIKLQNKISGNMQDSIIYVKQMK